MIKLCKDLELHIMNTSKPSTQDVDLCERSYNFWLSSWEKTFKTLNVKEQLTLQSDDFLERTLLGLFYESHPIGLLFSKEFCVKRSYVRNHSYFKNFPQEIFKKFDELNVSNICTLSYLTLHPDWRKQKVDIPVAELLISVGMKYFSGSKSDCVTAYIRKDSNFYKACYKHGGIQLCEQEVYNVMVDYFYIPQERLSFSEIRPEVYLATNNLWEQMLFRNRNKNKIIKGGLNEEYKRVI